MFFYKGKKPAAPAPVSPKSKAKAPVSPGKLQTAGLGRVPQPIKKAAPAKKPTPPVEPPEDPKAKKKKKKKNEEEESYAGMMTNWFNSIDTSQYVGTANTYIESAKAAASSAVTNYAPTSIQGAFGTDQAAPPASAVPVPTAKAPKPAGPPKKSALGGLFGVGGKTPVPKKAIVPPKAVVPKAVPSLPVAPVFDEVSADSEPPLIVKLGPRVPPKQQGPALTSASDLRKAMENLRIGGFDDEPLKKQRDIIVNQDPGPIVMEFEKLRPPNERLHPQVAPRRASDGDEPVGADAAYYGVLADAAGLEDPLDFVERSGIDRVIHSRQFIQAMKQSLSESKSGFRPASVLGDDEFHPQTNMDGRPISPSQDNLKTVAFLPPRSNMCRDCGLFDYACICHSSKQHRPPWDPLEASMRRKNAASRRSSHGNIDSPENSQDEGDPPNIITVNRRPQLNPLK